MSYNGSGTFLINTAGQPVVSGTVISSTAFNALTADLATGLSTAITKDGQTTVTANIPMGTYKFTGLGAGTAATDSANLSQVQSTVTKLLASVSGADTITAVGSPTLGAYAAGQMFYFIAAGDNTGAVTLNIDSLGAKAVTRDGTTALAAGDIQSGEVCVVVYDGTRFQLVNGASQSASIVTENLTVNKATVLNESGGDNDTRIEGDTDANLVFVDASTDRVGVGTSTPQAKFVASNGGANGYELDPVNGFISAYNRSTNAWTKITTRASSYTFNLSNTNDALNIDSSGNLGLGVTPSAWASGIWALQVGNRTGIVNGSAGNTIISNNWFTDGTGKYIQTGTACLYEMDAGQHRWFNAASGTAGNAITFTQAMTLDASGNLAIGTASPGYTAASRNVVAVNGTTSSIFALMTGGTNRGYLYADSTQTVLWSEGTRTLTIGTSSAGPIAFHTDNAERARITAAGQFLVGATSAYAFSSSTATGFQAQQDGAIAAYVSQGATSYFSRQGNDGTIVSLRQDGTEEGTISVSGNTVSYNAFAGSHWSQLQDGSKPDILRGTVMESINELCEWPDETNERLPKSKISDTAGSKKVYGVFMAWDNDWTATNDMYVTAVGAFICRVNGSVTVQEGDLLESNGDGTARVQADDIIRSSTIGKVTSTVKTHEYDDGSYCVPTVLYCG